MNTYRAEFFARCPANGARVRYSLRIETDSVVSVETINWAVDAIREGLHEDIADQLLVAIGHRQTLIAEHHGVTIETERP